MIFVPNLFINFLVIHFGTFRLDTLMRKLLKQYFYK